MNKYEFELTILPSPGQGAGLHPHLLRVANIGIAQGITPSQIFSDLRAFIPCGPRPVPDNEIRSAISTAWKDRNNSDIPDRATKPKIDGPAMLQRLIKQGAGATVDDIRKISPIYMGSIHPIEQLMCLMFGLYQPTEHVFLGGAKTPGILGKTVRTMSNWVDALEDAKEIKIPHIIANPLTGEQGKTKSGNPSFRSDDCISSHRYAILEFDGISIKDQLAFWAVIDLPVVALIHSGKKSIHGWIRVDCKDALEWEQEIENKLFPEYLIPLGIDRACKNESRLSRCPGHFRDGKLQELFYLAPEGKRVNL